MGNTVIIRLSGHEVAAALHEGTVNFACGWYLVLAETVWYDFSRVQHLVQYFSERLVAAEVFVV